MMKNLILPVFITFMLVFITFMLAAMLACGSREEKKMKLFEKGKTLYEQGDYVKAQLEFKNALQIDPKYADGYYWLGTVSYTHLRAHET